jgi:hypothetical protein
MFGTTPFKATTDMYIFNGLASCVIVASIIESCSVELCGNYVNLLSPIDMSTDLRSFFIHNSSMVKQSHCVPSEVFSIMCS